MKRSSWTVHEIRATRRDLAPQGALRMLSRFRVDLPAPNTVTGTYRRHRLHVPTPDEGGTTVGLGWKQDGLLFPGFGLDTVGHVVVQARGGKQESTAALLANGQLVVQSDDDGLYLFSRAPSVMGSTRVANVLGSGGVVLAAGFSATVENAPVTGMRPDRPAVDATLPTDMSAVVATWTRSDAKLAAAGAARDAAETKTSPSQATKLFGSFSSAEKLATAACLAANVPGDAGSSGDGIIVAHGTGGFLVGTPMCGTVLAEQGLVLASEHVVAIAHDDLDLYGAHHIKARSKKVNVIGSESAYFLSDETTLVASRHGRAFLGAPTVIIGGFPSQVRAPQDPTANIVATATNVISIATDQASEQRTRGIWVESSQELHLRAKQPVRAFSNEIVSLEAGTDRLARLEVVGGAQLVTVTAGASSLMLQPQAGIHLIQGTGNPSEAAPHVHVHAGGVTLGVAESTLDVGRDGVRLRGAKIRIG